MPNRNRAARSLYDRSDRYGTFSAAVDRVRQGEEVLTLIDPAARGRNPAEFSEWLSARLTIAELPRLLLPGCDDRCRSREHDPDAFVVLTDLSIDPIEPRQRTWWSDWNETLESEHQGGPIWYAGTPAIPATSRERRLVAGTRLRRVTVTDPYWVHYDAVNQEALFRILDGLHQGSSLVAVTFGPSPLLPALSGVLIAPDHPPVLDPVVAIRLLAAGWSAVERGLPFEE